MYDFADTVGGWLSLVTLVFFFIFIGQGIERLAPRNVLSGVIFGMSFLLAGLCIAYTTIYDKGREAARKEQEPDEVISRTGEEGVFLQPTGSHETDPFIEEEANE